MFDWRQLERWSADPGVLPANAVFVNRPPTLWGQYKGYVITAVLVILLLSAFVIAPLIQNRRRHLAEERFRLLFENSRDASMILRPPSWKYSGVNQATVELFGAASAAEFTALRPLDVSAQRQPDGHLSSEKAQEVTATARRDGPHFF